LNATDWTYGGKFTITNVKLFQGKTSTLKVSLVAGMSTSLCFSLSFAHFCASSSLAVSSTHGNAMGARTLFPAFSCSGTSCTITAPPNANISPPGWHQLFILDRPTPSHSVWVRIGGDPAQLGNWPDFPDFTLPGV
jgi:hypothetical protein